MRLTMSLRRRQFPPPAAPVTRPRGVYRLDSDRPGRVLIEVWDSTGTCLVESHMLADRAHAKTIAAFWHWLNAEDPQTPTPVRPAPPRPPLTLVS